jgi:hypothetical protein
MAHCPKTACPKGFEGFGLRFVIVHVKLAHLYCRRALNMETCLPQNAKSTA